MDRIFTRLDTNDDGVVTIEEFIESCQTVSEEFICKLGFAIFTAVSLIFQDPKISASLLNFDVDL